MLTAHAPAKVNLFLHVGPVQANGRHPLDSLVVFADRNASDIITTEKARALILEVMGPMGDALQASDQNIVLTAARALSEASGGQSGALLKLEKHLPVAAGIGGGSADAGAALRLLTDLWELGPALAQGVAPGLGGDVPVALLGRCALMQGEGEWVRPVQDLSRLPALLVNPGIACPTGPVFQAFDTEHGAKEFTLLDEVPAFDSIGDLIDWLTDMRNDLQTSATRLVPQINDVLVALSGLPGARLVRMSGSGATCFALFETGEAAQAAETSLQAEHPSWWVRATSLGDSV